MDADCPDVGSTNPDIAGLGIVIAFAFQAGVSLVLSIWSFLLWKSAVASLLDANPGARIMFHAASLRFQGLKGLNEIIKDAFGLAHNTDEGDAMRAPRRALSNFYRRHESSWVLRKCTIDGILLAISDTQTVNGLSLLIAGLAQYKSLSLYHMHIIYDTVNFTAVSMCGSLANVYGQDKKSRRSRLYAFVAFSALYLAFSVVFATKLRSWDLTESGQCYNYSLISLPNHGHPSDDIIYVGITCFWCLCVLICCGQIHSSFMSEIYQENANNPGTATSPITALAEKWGVRGVWHDLLDRSLRDVVQQPSLERLAASIVVLAMLQYPVHLYMVIALRISNEGNLSGDSENTWGFGQIVALVTAFSTLMECVRGYSVIFQDYCAGIKLLEEAASTEEPREANIEARLT
ncbi:unnamed protein product [Clonostachys solani]|uniref:Uncharacterized protein n=1 Tax=Clonostachys solani TaxID=160281 RepID=A0A9N9ZL17_9HYPO|nr:unnamed protein product [Clonostachys solani]